MFPKCPSTGWEERWYPSFNWEFIYGTRVVWGFIDASVLRVGCGTMLSTMHRTFTHAVLAEVALTMTPSGSLQPHKMTRKLRVVVQMSPTCNSYPYGRQELHA